MSLSYVAYFLFMPVFGGILIISGIWRRPGPKLMCAWYVCCVLVTYYLHYLVFFLFPVQGPAFHFDAGIALDPGFVINRFHQMIVSRGDVPGGCFPSSHVAVALLHALIAWRLRWRWLCAISAVITVSICLSIVYTRTHYAVDAVAGLISAVLCWFLIAKINRMAAARANAGS
jgi:membrane-associated phospholipid phosphatase